MNTRVKIDKTSSEEVAEILHEHGIDRATIKQTKHMAYSLIERE